LDSARFFSLFNCQGALRPKTAVRDGGEAQPTVASRFTRLCSGWLASWSRLIDLPSNRMAKSASQRCDYSIPHP
jgi:hypothetical protein